jgi:hypothetical protein
MEVSRIRNYNFYLKVSVVSFELSMVVMFQVEVFWVVTWNSVVARYQKFQRSTLKVDTVWTFETLISHHKTKRRHNPEGLALKSLLWLTFSEIEGNIISVCIQCYVRIWLLHLSICFFKSLPLISWWRTWKHLRHGKTTDVLRYWALNFVL